MQSYTLYRCIFVSCALRHIDSEIPRNLELVLKIGDGLNVLFIHRVWSIVRRIKAASGMDSLDLRSQALLDLIGANDTEPLRVSDLVKLAGLGTPPTIYSALAELERGGWIAKFDDPEDGRASRLKLSAKSKRAYAKMSREIADL